MGRIDRDRATLYRQGVSGCNALGVLSLYTLYSQSERVWRTENGRESSSTLLGGSFKMCACLRTTLYGFVQTYVTVAHTHGAEPAPRRGERLATRAWGGGCRDRSEFKNRTEHTHDPHPTVSVRVTHHPPSTVTSTAPDGGWFHLSRLARYYALTILVTSHIR